MLHRRTVLLAATALSVSGCATTINLSWNRPARLQLSAGQRIAVEVNPDGRPPPATGTSMLNAAINLLAQSQVMGPDSAVDPLAAALVTALRREGLTVVDPPYAEVVVRAVPTHWRYESNGILGSGHGRLDARLEVVDVRQPQAQPIFRDCYWATASGNGMGEPEVMMRAADRLAHAFTRELRPTRVCTRVEMDSSDPIVSTGLELCHQDQFDAAYAALSDAVRRSPSSAPALYDLAVMAEIRGSYDEAESLLIRATGIASKSIYFIALARVRVARNDAAGIQATQ